MYMYMYMYMYVCIHVCVYIYIYTYTYMIRITHVHTTNTYSNMINKYRHTPGVPIHQGSEEGPVDFLLSCVLHEGNDGILC